MSDKKKLLKELIKKQKEDVPEDLKLNANELMRLCKYIDNNIFSKDKCCLWKGYISNSNNDKKPLFVNFYFRGKKRIIHRLLYYNFVDKIGDNEYIKLLCVDKKCCNINHFIKFNYKTQNKEKKKVKNKDEPLLYIFSQEPGNNNLRLEFD